MKTAGIGVVYNSEITDIVQVLQSLDVIEMIR
jgi:hypothetical protein